jgi:chromosome segregation ATPase
MQEASTREERLREEVNEARKRWQEAISSRENLASELGSATAPLLRQIASLQEAIRTKSEAWQTVESSLSERALRAESIAEVAEHRKVLFEEQLNELKQQLASLQGRYHEAQETVQANEGAADRLRKLEITSSEKIMELESKLALEIGQRQSLQSSLRELELRHKMDQQDSRDNVDIAVKQSEIKLAQARAQIESLKEELAAEKAKIGSLIGSGGQVPNKKLKLQMQQQQQHHQQQQMGLATDSEDSDDDDGSSSNGGGGGSGKVGRKRYTLLPTAMLPST